MFSLFGGGPRLAGGLAASGRGGAGASSPLMSGADCSSRVRASFLQSISARVLKLRRVT